MKPSIMDVNLEQAAAIAESLENPHFHATKQTTVYSGRHPKYGDVHVVIPAMGDALLLPADLQLKPVVLQNFS